MSRDFRHCHYVRQKKDVIRDLGCFSRVSFTIGSIIHITDFICIILSTADTNLRKSDIIAIQLTEVIMQGTKHRTGRHFYQNVQKYTSKWKEAFF